MKVTRILASFALLAGFAGAAHAEGCARISWGSCDPWNKNTNFVAGPMTLVYSATGLSSPNVGTDSNLHIYGGGAGVPDAWRFDDAGCQTGSQLLLGTNAFNKACPALKGANSLTITQYSLDLAGEADLRLAITYDNQSPIPATRYTVWTIVFDHTFSSVGPTPGDLSTCGGAEIPLNLRLSFAKLLATTGFEIPIQPCDQDVTIDPNAQAFYQGGVHVVATQPATWGKVKGLYH